MLKTYFELKQLTLRFQNEKAYMGKYAKDGGFYYMKIEGLLSIFTREGVSSNVNRRIKIGRLELDQRRERKGWPAGTVFPAARRHCRQCRGRRSMRYRG